MTRTFMFVFAQLPRPACAKGYGAALNFQSSANASVKIGGAELPIPPA
jgi:hypothetical protein